MHDIKPYRDAHLNTLYTLLFCDQPDLYRPDPGKANEYPWNILFGQSADIPGLQGIVEDATLESRIRLLAYRLLRENAVRIPKKELLGVVIEVGLDEGLDVLAAYQDGGARYLNYSGKMIILETADTHASPLISQLFTECERIIAQIGPWDQPRRPAPVRGIARMTFLVSDGLYFGEGPITVLFNDPMAGPALMSATRLMQFLIESSQQSHAPESRSSPDR